jgi:hypothetical protein
MPIMAEVETTLRDGRARFATADDLKQAKR